MEKENFNYSMGNVMNFIMIYSIVVLFIIPNETYLKINKFLLIFFMLNLILSIYKIVNLSKLELITAIAFIAIPFLLIYYKEPLRSFGFIKELIYLYPFFLFRRYEKCELNFKGIQVVYYLALVSLIVQIFRYRYLDRMVLSVIDPNVSGGIILLFYYLSIKLNKKFGIAFSMLCCLLFKSRNLLLALGVFFIVKYFKKYFKKVIDLIDIRVVFIMIYVLFIFINILYLKKYNFDNIEIGYSENMNRLTNVVDHSNTYRFMFNTEVLNNLLKNMKLFFIGGEKLYISSVDKNIFVEVSPHNDFLKDVYFYGFIFTGIKFIYILGTIQKKIKIYENYEFIISYIVFGSFLGAIILIPNVYIFYFCLLLDEKLKNGWEIDEVNSNNTCIQC